MKLTHWDSACRCFCFEKLAIDNVDLELRNRANEVVAFVCTELHISPLPEVIWIQPASAEVVATLFGPRVQACFEERHPFYTRIRREKDIQGGFTPEHLTQVWIRSDLSAFPALEYAAAHETRHIWQKVRDINIFRDECRAEGDAYPYGYDVLKRYLTGRACLTPELEADIDNKRVSARSIFLQTCPEGRFEVIKT